MQPILIDIVRRAYELWERAGRPEGRDQEFYLEAERELSGRKAPADSQWPGAK
jgi:hypothetical protein